MKVLKAILLTVLFTFVTNVNAQRYSKEEIDTMIIYSVDDIDFKVVDSFLFEIVKKINNGKLMRDQYCEKAAEYHSNYLEAIRPKHDLFAHYQKEKFNDIILEHSDDRISYFLGDLNDKVTPYSGEVICWGSKWFGLTHRQIAINILKLFKTSEAHWYYVAEARFTHMGFSTSFEKNEFGNGVVRCVGVMTKYVDQVNGSDNDDFLSYDDIIK